MSLHRSQRDLDLGVALSRLHEAARAASAAHLAEDSRATVRAIAELMRLYDGLETLLTGVAPEPQREAAQEAA